MKNKAWKLIDPIDAIVFDCDSTLSQVEGIDILSDMNQVLEPVHRLTEAAMQRTGINSNLYRKRLDLVQPTADQVEDLILQYEQHVTPDASQIISIFQNLGKAVYVISAGVYPAVLGFSLRLGIPESKVFAVELMFDKKGRYQNFNEQSPLIHDDGKSQIIKGLRAKHHRFAHIGDGMNDIQVLDEVNRFIGYGGSAYREHIANRCEFYITSLSLSPVLPLLLTQEEVETLTGDAKPLYERGLRSIQDNGVEFRRFK